VQDETTQTNEPMELDDIVADVWTATHAVDVRQVIETICERATKFGSVESIVCAHLGVDDLDPETLLRHVIGEYYSGLISAEDRLVWGCGVTSEVAAALVALSDANSARSNAEDALFEILGPDLDAACQRVWDETHETDNPLLAAQAMLGSMPAIAAGCRQVGIDLTELMAEYCSDFIADLMAEQPGDDEEGGIEFADKEEAIQHAMKTLGLTRDEAVEFFTLPAFHVEITPEFAEQCRRDGLSGGEMIATAVANAAKAAGIEDIEVEFTMGPDPERINPALRDGYTAQPDPRES
jgi:hypothetical protein